MGGRLIIEAIVDIGRISIEDSVIPGILRPVWVTPVWKKTNREDPSDYRPISITNHILKVIERVISEQMTNYLTDNSVILSDQHGGRAGRSTLTQLMEQNDHVLYALTKDTILRSSTSISLNNLTLLINPFF